MSNLDKEKEYGNPADALKFIFNQMLKDIFISIPGIIESYDPISKRCRVRPAIKIRLTDGSTESQGSIVNVPVLWPSGGGFSLLAPLPSGSPVEIRFSQRGITAFKETFKEENPGNGIFEKEDAHVIPSFGSLSVSPASLQGMCLQSEDGSNYIYVEDGEIKSFAAAKIITEAPNLEETATMKTLTAVMVNILSSTINLGTGLMLGLMNATGITVYNSHTHPETGGPNTGPPNQQMDSSNLTSNTKAS